MDCPVLVDIDALAISRLSGSVSGPVNDREHESKRAEPATVLEPFVITPTRQPREVPEAGDASH
jgi:hypothetical protein